MTDRTPEARRTRRAGLLALVLAVALGSLLGARPADARILTALKDGVQANPDGNGVITY